ncbi:ribosome hibernation-promoting factor, HPF/YfiA family [Pajaroellobacter abortibovis]|uniref:Ribosome hibernation promoting factor n=1 Tax=Pajaroellobacter abortibovis TaxID=1882918 RepID=A0A1L6MX40_9BACT|nr:ribosome-associated translation inhibitor RaiA [Pajaroellobacter abortibovis]APS00121.1 ribosomal subunit interface protein [Pajaroellobacter abortibovis]
MNITISFRHMQATEAMKVHVLEKVGKLQKFFRQPLQGQVVMSCQNHRLHSVEMDLQAGSVHFHAHDTTEDMYATVDKVIDKLHRQIGDEKSANTTKKKGGERMAEHFEMVPPASKT